jgi:hypothetical protein
MRQCVLNGIEIIIRIIIAAIEIGPCIARIIGGGGYKFALWAILPRGEIEYNGAERSSIKQTQCQRLVMYYRNAITRVGR